MNPVECVLIVDGFSVKLLAMCSRLLVSFSHPTCPPLDARQALQVRNFTAGLELFKRIAEVAEAEGHHPDLHLEGWNNVSAVLNTHSVGAVSMSLPVPTDGVCQGHGWRPPCHVGGSQGSLRTS